ncbi:MAG: hypothetical protein HZB67_01895 [Candidatus Aenigmarchaeota archaeon]|nr:hypothetical protein [Candidatus Aenigmarchaeota archaeon]
MQKSITISIDPNGQRMLDLDFGQSRNFYQILPRNRCDMDDGEYLSNLRRILSGLERKWVSLSFCDESHRTIRTYQGELIRCLGEFYMYNSNESARFGPIDAQITNSKEAQVGTTSGYQRYSYIELWASNARMPKRMSEQELLEREYAMTSADHFRD